MKKREKLIKSEVVKMFDTTKETLRHYENIGLIQPEIDDRKYRYYGFEEMAKLRQLFVLKDFGFQLEEMKDVMSKKVSQEDFTKLLKKQDKLLQKKIERFINIQNNISAVLDMLKYEKYNINFKLKEYKTRPFIMFDSKDSIDRTPKGYYDKFKGFIQKNYYTERVIINCFGYNSLDNFDPILSKFCFEIENEEDILDLVSSNREFLKYYEAGNYLSVFYVFDHYGINDLSNVKEQIDKYIEENNLVIKDYNVLEFEHLELGMLLEDSENLYEMQIRVGYK